MARWAVQIGYTRYDAAGNISKIGDFLYQYDAFHRLKEEEESFFPRQSAVYDPYGNLTQLTTLSAVESMPADTSTNRLAGATYDDAGNLTNITLGQQQQFDFDGLGMLKTQQTPSGVRAYLYDASDERVMRWDCPLDECGPDTSKEHITIRGLNGEVLRVYEGTERADRKWKEDTIYRDGQPLIRIQDAGQGTQKLHALHHDHLGSVRQVTNWLGEEVSRHRYYPFGKEATPVASSDPNHKFTGHERDEGFQSGEPLDYMHARYCSPVLGRFLSVDPVNGSPGTPQSWNRFAYVRNNPIKLLDPDGEEAIVATLQIAAGSGASFSLPPFVAAAAPTAAIVGGGHLGVKLGRTLGGFEISSGLTIDNLISDFVATEVLGALDGFPADVGPNETMFAMAGTKGLEQQLQDHIRKLADYLANPEANDNRGFLRDAPPDRREQIIQGRIHSLQTQIENFRRLIEEARKKSEVDEEASAE